MTQRDTIPMPVVVINSEEAFLIAVRILLEDEGYEVTTASYRDQDPFSAIVTAEPALIILDFVHGEPDGRELLAQLDNDARTRTIPLIATSTDQELLDRVMAQAVSARVRTFLLKPLDLERLGDDVSLALHPE